MQPGDLFFLSQEISPCDKKRSRGAARQRRAFSTSSECRWYSFRTDRNEVKTRNGVESARARAWKMLLSQPRSARECAFSTFFAQTQTRIWKSAAAAVYGPRGRQEGKTVSCPIKVISMFAASWEQNPFYSQYYKSIL